MKVKSTLIIVTLISTIFLINFVSAEDQLLLQYREIPARGVVYWPLGEPHFYDCETPYAIKVVITDCDYTVHVRIVQSDRAILFDGELSEGQNTGWISANEQYTWVEIDHPGSLPPAIYYEGKICIYFS